jgi:hypothetical protein
VQEIEREIDELVRPLDGRSRPALRQRMRARPR